MDEIQGDGIMRWFGNRARTTVVGVATATVILGALVPVTAGAATAPRNLVSNGSVELRSGAKPTSWLQIAAGRNHRTFGHLHGGARSGGFFVRTAMHERYSGHAGWSFAPVAVSGGASYTYADAIRSNTSTALRARMVSRTGVVSYRSFTPASATSAWRSGGITFTLPKDTARLSMERLLTHPGVLDLDTASLTLRRPAPASKSAPKPAPAPATGALVSITFDDGLSSQYANARPTLSQNGIPATFYLISSHIGASGYMNAAEARALQGAGHEIGSHSATHANLTQVSPSQLTSELAGSKTALEAQFGTIRSLAYPYGAYNAGVATEAARIYQTARTTDGGLNQRGAIDRGQLRMRYVMNTTDAATVAGWMDEAANAGAWTILVYHGVAEGGDVYSVTPAQFAAQMAAVKSSGLRTATVSAAYDAMT